MELQEASRTKDRLTLAIVCLVPILVSVILPLSGASRYVTADDISMILIASGAMTGEISSDLVFTSVPFGIGMAILYSASTSVPWWALIQGLSIGVALSLSGILILRNSWRVSLGLCLVLYLNLLALPTFLFMNFTQPAIVCSIIGATVVLSSRTTRAKAAGWCVFLLGVLWRPEGALLGLVAATSIVLVLLESQQKSGGVSHGKLRRLAVPIGLLGLSYVATSVVPSWLRVASDTQYAEYLAFNDARASFDGMGNFIFSREGARSADEAGLTSTAWKLLQQWFLQDTRLFPTEVLTSIGSEREVIPPMNSIPRLLFEFSAGVMSPPIMWTAVLWCLGVVAIAYVSTRRGPILIAGVVVIGIAFCVFIYGRAPERVVVPLLIGTSASLLIVTSRSIPGSILHRHAPFLVGGVLVVTLLCQVYVLPASLPQGSPRAPLLAGLTDCGQMGKRIALLPTEFFAPRLIQLPVGFDPVKDVDMQNSVLLDWRQRSPQFERHLISLGLQRDVLDSVASGQAAVVSSSRDLLHSYKDLMVESLGVSQLLEIENGCIPNTLILRSASEPAN